MVLNTRPDATYSGKCKMQQGMNGEFHFVTILLNSMFFSRKHYYYLALSSFRLYQRIVKIRHFYFDLGN